MIRSAATKTSRQLKLGVAIYNMFVDGDTVTLRGATILTVLPLKTPIFFTVFNKEVQTNQNKLTNHVDNCKHM